MHKIGEDATRFNAGLISASTAQRPSHSAFDQMPPRARAVQFLWHNGAPAAPPGLAYAVRRGRARSERSGFVDTSVGKRGFNQLGALCRNAMPKYDIELIDALQFVVLVFDKEDARQGARSARY